MKLSSSNFMSEMTDAVSWGHQYMLLLKCDSFNNHELWHYITVDDVHLLNRLGSDRYSNSFACVYLILFDADDHIVYKKYYNQLKNGGINKSYSLGRQAI